jgi:hypothetical protein
MKGSLSQKITRTCNPDLWLAQPGRVPGGDESNEVNEARDSLLSAMSLRELCACSVC